MKTYKDVPSIFDDEEKPARKRPHGAQEYRGNGNHKWEPVTTETMRLRVPGGWLYAVANYTITFVPVPNAVGYVV